MARFLFAASPYYRISDMMAALGLPNDAFRVINGVLHIKDVDQEVFDEAIQDLDSLGALRDSVSTTLQQACASAIAAGINYKENLVPMGERDQTSLIGICLAAVNGQARGKHFSSKFWVKNPKWIRQEFTGDEFIEIGEAALAHIQSQQSHYADLLEQVAAATSAAQLLALYW